ncbi:enoyl-CoA hydratase-related protein [Mesohalobacter halotolerans]|jgi:2-(1,2-epoxy-1,2-dihydrophenyl)acetyl-CoA isomerase|uniref:2-(1,2-epoxy-1,2-dihydrophenyl)acetyl-CoA isomerase n=1 Tax=Mesohalobacter halotolerans TaxID=1883405 RepID=A0A4U5TQ57_9FLAO|nr:enoyl-CoA hydratase-related protein [Mesohalobacter halotolerans]MBS3739125.1 enoyl-CoA hydratase/isomerase family protein [Psychroflexus sp.]NBC59088.1 2-(1,2-epoxy-1,2-dihydrophenyl)acetyl-CoA isomerase [Bacteroidota bacterium]TKS55861.1 2-(1,2-epoxy-1,2-dihydrophenyl)acetyl-CoA isomerase [Mesohalobacter halotolerans]
MSSIIKSQNQNITYLYLNRPEKFNSFNREMALSLQKHLDDCIRDKNTRAIVLIGKGKAFCAGQDLQEVTNPDENPGFKKILEEHYNPIVTRIRNIEIPVIAAVNGVAAGAGANLALCCDIVVACEKASFIQAFSKIGLIPDSGGTYFLPRLVGFQRASALAMLGDKIDAFEAERMGMIYTYYSSETFEKEVEKLAQRLANMPTKALSYIKKALNQSLENGLENQLALESKYQIASAQTDDYQEGVNAFVDKRQPKFKGK